MQLWWQLARVRMLIFESTKMNNQGRGGRAGTIPQLTDESHLCDLNDEAFRRLFCSLIKHDINLLVKLPTWQHKSPIQAKNDIRK